MTKDDLPLPRLLTIWWAMVWRGLLFGLGGGFVVGFIEGIILAMVGLREIITPVSTVSGFLVGPIVGVWILRTVLTKSFKDFEIVIRPKTAVFSDPNAA